MLYLLLSIGLSVLLLLNFRLFPRYGVDTFQAIVFNYPVCFLTGLVLLPRNQTFSFDFSQDWTWLALGLGVGFIITFLLSGASTQRVGMTVTSLANNLSLVIPVTVSLFFFKTGGKSFDVFNYAGLTLALVAVGFSAVREEGDSSQRQKGGFGALLPLAVFSMYGLTNTLINYMNIRYIPSADKTVIVTLTMVAGAIAAGLVMLIIRLIQGSQKLHFRNMIAAITLGVPNYLSFYTLLLALSAFKGNGAFVYPLYNIGVIVVAAGVASVLFREKLLLVNLIGLLLALLAIGLISWQELYAFIQH